MVNHLGHSQMQLNNFQCIKRVNISPMRKCLPSTLRTTMTTTTTLLLLLLLQPFNSLFSRTTWVSQYQKGKTSLDLNEARDNGVWGCSGISWTICKQSAPRSRYITTPTPHRTIFTGQMLFLTPNQQCQSTEGQYILQTSKITYTDTCFFDSRCSKCISCNQEAWQLC